MESCAVLVVCMRATMRTERRRVAYGLGGKSARPRLSLAWQAAAVGPELSRARDGSCSRCAQAAVQAPLCAILRHSA